MGTGRSAVERVRAALEERGIPVEVRELPRSTRTAPEAAQAVGLSVSQIVKSLVFMAGDEPVLVCASGNNRVDLDKLSVLVGRETRQASPHEVRAATGFSIGGVPPVGHDRALRTFVDGDLFHYGEICAAAGTPQAVFLTSPHDLLSMTRGERADLKEAPPP